METRGEIKNWLLPVTAILELPPQSLASVWDRRKDAKNQEGKRASKFDGSSIFLILALSCQITRLTT